MSDFQHEGTEIFAGMTILVILFACCWSWFVYWKNRKHSIIVKHVLLPWNVSWLDFSLVMWVGFVAFLGITLGMQHFFFRDTMVMPHQPGDAVTWAMVVFGSSVQIALGITVVGVMIVYRISLFKRELDHIASFKLGVIWIVRIFPLLWFTSAMSSWLFEKLGIGSGEQETVSMFFEISDPLMFLFSGVIAVVVAPVLEELFFRVLVFRFLLGKMKPLSALLMSSCFFSILHFNIDSIIPIFILGIALGKIYQMTGDIKSAIWMHALFNAHTMLIISFDKWVLSFFF